MTTQKIGVRTKSAVALTALLTMTLAACSGSDPDQPVEEANGDLVIVASTDVYQEIAANIVGDAHEVEAIISGSALDPHSYEATPQDKLTLDRADVIIANGGGYDPFIDQLTASLGNEDKVIYAFTGEGHSHDHEDEHEHDHEDAEAHDHDHEHADEHDHEDAEAHEDEHEHDHEDAEAHDHDHEHADEHEHAHDHEHSTENEHIWYDLGEMATFTLELSEAFSELDPENAEMYQENGESFAAELTELQERAEAINGSGDFLTTEPVSEYLLLHAGFTNVTDTAFLSAVEHDQDLSPVLLKEAEDILEEGNVQFLAYNTQTETAQTQALKDVAEQNDIPVLDFTETLPDGQNFVEWMRANIETIEELT